MTFDIVYNFVYTIKESRGILYMKLTKDELLQAVKAEHEAPSEDGYVKLLEDISDSMEDVTAELESTISDLQTQVEELKQKYIDRFFNGEEKEDEVEDTGDKVEEAEDGEETTIDDLFEEVNE